MRFAPIPILILLIGASCVDQIIINVHKPKSEAIAVEGFISNQPGPYEIRIQNVYDVESKEDMRSPVSVKKLELIDDAGNADLMKEIIPGFYQTPANGIQGTVGRAYKIRIELYDGRIYESWPDTIKAPGKLDSMYYSVRDEINSQGTKDYLMDVFFDAMYDPSPTISYIWKFKGTFQSETQPELYYEYHIGSGGPCNLTGLCFYLDEIFKCNLVPPCSGLLNTGTICAPNFERRNPCSCCSCWYNIVNKELILSSDNFVTKGIITGKKVQSIPINEWTMMHKVRLSMEQHTLTRNSFRFYKAIENQKQAIGSLFQPITGQIPSNFIQLSGPTVRAEGLFYATSISAKVKYITKDDLPIEVIGQIPTDRPIFPDDCRYKFPHSTNVKPTFWVD